MAIVFITGMSGTGKSTVLVELSRRGFQVVDTARATGRSTTSMTTVLRTAAGIPNEWRDCPTTPAGNVTGVDAPIVPRASERRVFGRR